jgi:hypothetical protein
VADQQDPVVDPVEGAERRGDVGFVGVQAVLRADHLVSFRLQRRDQLVEA